jgi:hypothetical protein
MYTLNVRELFVGKQLSVRVYEYVPADRLVAEKNKSEVTIGEPTGFKGVIVNTEPFEPAQFTK